MNMFVNGINANKGLVQSATEGVASVIKTSFDNAMSYAESVVSKIKSMNSDLNIEYDSGSGYSWGKDSSGKTDTGNSKYDRDGDGRTSVWESNTGRNEEAENWVKNNRDKVEKIKKDLGVDHISICEAYERHKGSSSSSLRHRKRRRNSSSVSEKTKDGKTHKGSDGHTYDKSGFRIKHSGGPVKDTGEMRYFNPFTTLGEFFNTLKSNEVATILEDDEFVLTKDMMGSLQNAMDCATSLKIPTNTGNLNLSIDIDYEKLANAIASKIKPSVTMHNNFQSPKALDEREIRKNQTVLLRNMSLEWGL